eukprot:3996645-Karenia_brevis.AAC.1
MAVSLEHMILMRRCRSTCLLWPGVSSYASGVLCDRMTHRGWHYIYLGECRRVSRKILIDPKQVGQAVGTIGWSTALARSVVCARRHG